jgi:hypothetical protein
MSGWQSTTKKANGKSKPKSQKGVDPTKDEKNFVQKSQALETDETMFSIFNDVDKIKAENQQKVAMAKKKAERKIIQSDFSADVPADASNFEKQMAAKAGAQQRQKKKGKAAPTTAAAITPSAALADLKDSWDTKAFIQKLGEIEAKGAAEHVQVLMIAEYMEEQLLAVDYDWAAMVQNTVSYDMSESAINQPLSYLPNKACEAAVKWLRKRSAAAKVGLTAFLIAQTWATMEADRVRGSGIGVRMLLQLVACENAGALAANLHMLPLAGAEKLVDRATDAAKSKTAISPAQKGHACSFGSSVWVLKQLSTNAGNARSSTFGGWWRYVLPLLEPAVPARTRGLMLSLSSELFGAADYGSMADVGSPAEVTFTGLTQTLGQL